MNTNKKGMATWTWMLIAVVATLVIVNVSSHGTPSPSDGCTMSVAGLSVAGLNCSAPPPTPPPVNSTPPPVVIPQPPIIPPTYPLSLPGNISLVGTGNIVIYSNTLSSRGQINFEATHPTATSIEFYVDSTWLGRDLASPYTMYASPTQPPLGMHNLTVIAYTGTYPSLTVVGWVKYPINVVS